jgi:Uma2 family endonuclease
MKFTITPNEKGEFTLPEGFHFNPGEPLTLYTEEREEESYFPLYLETNENCRFTDEQFTEFSVINDDRYSISRTHTHQIVIEMPTTRKTTRTNAKFATYLGMWNLEHELGEVQESSGGYLLPDGAVYAPDASFVTFTRLDKLTPEQQEEDKFTPLAPDFAAEIMSKSDSLAAAKRKMQEVWMKNGVETGLLIDPKREMYYVYTQGEEEPKAFPFEVLFSCSTLPYFELNLHDIL